MMGSRHPRRALGFPSLFALTFFCVAGGAYGLEDAGTAGVIALSVPPVALCGVSMVLANTPTKLVSVGGIGLGLIVYWAISVRRKGWK